MKFRAFLKFNIDLQWSFLKQKIPVEWSKPTVDKRMYSQ